jgi:hypothetical protein
MSFMIITGTYDVLRLRSPHYSNAADGRNDLRKLARRHWGRPLWPVARPIWIFMMILVRGAP